MEVERSPNSPGLSPKVVDLLTELCFRNDDEVKTVDGIFVFSTLINIPESVNIIEDLLSKGISRKLFITGGVTPADLVKEVGVKPNSTEADLLLTELDTSKYDDLELFVERNSTNTPANVTETLQFVDFSKLNSLLLIFK